MSESTSTEKNLVYHDWTKEDYGEYRRKMCRESQRKRRAKARLNGMCSICCKYPAIEGYKTCQDCYSRVRVWQAKHKGGNNG